MRDTKNFAAMSDPTLNPGFRRSWTEPPHCKNPSIVGSAAAEIVADMQFCQTVERVHALGARPLAEMLAEIAVKHSIVPAITETLERYASIDPQALQALGGEKFWPVPIREVRS